MPAVRGAYKGAVVRHPRRRLKLRRIHHLPAAAAAGKPSAQPPPPRSPADGTAGATRLGAAALGGASRRQDEVPRLAGHRQRFGLQPSDAQRLDL